MAGGTETKRLIVREPNMFLMRGSLLNSSRQKGHIHVTRENAERYSTISKPFCKDHMNNQHERTSCTIYNRMEEVVRVETHPESIPVTETGAKRLV